MSTSDSPSSSFAVITLDDKLTIQNPNTSAISETSYNDVASIMRAFKSLCGFQSKFGMCFDRVFGTSKLPAGLTKPNVASIHIAYNGFFSALIFAYSYHRTLVMRPDDIWLLITTSAATHINKNAEKYRYSFVTHADKMKLEVDLTDTMPGLGGFPEWDIGVDRICKLIGQNTTQDVVDAFQPSFSTTDRQSAIAGRIVCMGAMKEYFSYSMVTCCGIPKVEMRGTVGDWEALINKTRKLREMLVNPKNAMPDENAEQYFDNLLPVLDMLLLTRKNENLQKVSEWWSHVCTIDVVRGSGGGTYYNGWFRKLYMYNADLTINKTVSRTTIDKLPVSMVQVPFVYDANGNHIDSLLHSGHAAYVIRVSDGAVIPMICWAVTNSIQSAKPKFDFSSL